MKNKKQENYMALGQKGYEDFVRTWQKADRLEDVMEKFKLGRVQASMKASILRKKGVPLKKFSRGQFGRLDYTALAEVAKE
jgi:hypothetical protein